MCESVWVWSIVEAGRDDAVKADGRGTGKGILPFAGTGILLFQVQAE